MSLMLQRCLRLQLISRTNAQYLLPALHIKSKRNESTLPLKSTAATATAADKWIPIYRLPLIRWAAAFNRLKIYQTILTIGIIPTVYTFEEAGLLATNTWHVCGAVGISGIITLTIASFGIQNIVGFIYINELENKIKLAYVNFWGKRKELEIDVDDLMPDLEQKKPSQFDFYQTIRLHSNDKLTFKLFQRYGVAVDPEKFIHFFGE